MTEHADTVGLGYGGSCNSQTLSQEQQVVLTTTIVITTIIVINITIIFTIAGIILIFENMNELCIELG